MDAKGLWAKLKGQKYTVWAVLIFLVLFALSIYKSAEADEFTMRGGATAFNVREGLVIMADTRFDVGPGDARTALGVYVIGESKYKDGRDLGTQAGMYAMLVDRLGPAEFGLGVAYQQVDDFVVSTPWRFALTVGWRFDNQSVWVPDAARLFHMSTAGSSPINSGWDLLLLDWTIR